METLVIIGKIILGFISAIAWFSFISFGLPVLFAAIPNRRNYRVWRENFERLPKTQFYLLSPEVAAAGEKKRPRKGYITSCNIESRDSDSEIYWSLEHGFIRVGDTYLRSDSLDPWASRWHKRYKNWFEKNVDVQTMPLWHEAIAAPEEEEWAEIIEEKV